MIRVVDTSVVAKWLVEEEGSQRAEALLGEALVAPDLALIEIANVIWKKVRQGSIAREQADFSLSMVHSFIEVRPSTPLVQSALAIALDLGHPVYDCHFLALAEAADIPLLTFDRRLRSAVADSRFEALVEFMGDE